MEILEQWEASAKVRYSQYKDTDAVLIPVGNLRGEQERILSLIAVVRKQREALLELGNPPHARLPGEIIREALVKAERILKG